jgi:hypothetical protein
LEEPEEILRSIPGCVYDELGRAAPELEAELAQRARRELDALAAERSAWPKRTTNDAIVTACAKLDRAGIIALENAGYTMSEGWDEVAEEAHHRPKARGATFYHGQDLERAVDGHGLHLAFGSLPSDHPDEHERSRAIGSEVVGALEKEGVAVEWDGTVKTRIRILPFPWQRRFLPR